MLAAILAFDRVIRIRGRGEAQLRGRAGTSGAAPRVHGGERLGFVGESHVARGLDGLRDWRAKRRRLAQELAMGGVTEIEIAVASATGGQVRASRNRLRFECLEWRLGHALGGDDGGDGSFTVHRNYGEQMSG